MPPLISVLLPAYNAEKYLEDSINSILNQTFRNFELIAINDGSTDRTGSILRALASKDSRIIIIDNGRNGLCKSLNQAIAIARGTYLARMDADDIAYPERFTRELAYMEANPKCVALGTGMRMVDRDGRPYADSHATALTHEDIDGRHIKGWCSINSPTAIMRATTVRKVNGYHERFFPADDMDLWLRLGEIGLLANLPDILLDYRVHTESLTRTLPDTMQKGAELATDEARERRRLPAILRATHCASGPHTPTNRAQQARLLAREASAHGYAATAWHWGIQAIKRQPHNPRSWWMLGLAVRAALRKDN